MYLLPSIGQKSLLMFKKEENKKKKKRTIHEMSDWWKWKSSKWQVNKFVEPKQVLMWKGRLNYQISLMSQTGTR